MFNSMKSVLAAALIVLVTGCATGSIQNRLQNNENELTYLHDSAKVAEKNGGTVKISSFIVDDVLPPSTTVKNTSWFVLPFLFVDIWKYDYQASLGYEQIKNNYKKFIQESFIEELKRSGKFRHAEDKGNMEIGIKIKKIAMSAPIRKDGMFLVGSMTTQTSAGPVDVVVTADAVVKKDGKDVFSKELLGKHRTNALSAHYTANEEGKFLDDYATAMVECLSIAIKNLNENIVKEINAI